MPALIVFCGIPGSGKSTIAKLVAAGLPGTVHVQTDAVRAMIAEPTYTSDESEFVYSACINLAGDALVRGYNAILDGTFLREEFRRDALQRLKSAYDSHMVVYVQCDATTAYRRNAIRKAYVPQKRYNQMISRLEEPKDALKIDSGRVSAEDAAAEVLRHVKAAKEELK